MASGSGKVSKKQDDIQTKEPPPRREESTAATDAAGTTDAPDAAGTTEAPDTDDAAAAAAPPPPGPPSERLQERADGAPQAGGRNPSAATAAAAEAADAAQRKGTGIMATSSAGGKPLLQLPATSISRAREPSSASGNTPVPRRAVPVSKAKKPMSAAADPPPPGPPSERLQERADGAPHAGGRNPSAATAEAAAATQRKGKGIEATSSAGGKPFLQLPATSVSRAREREQKDQVKSATIWHEKDCKGSFCRKVRSPAIWPEIDYNRSLRRKVGRRRRKIHPIWTSFIIILLLMAYVPSVTGFKRFQSLDSAATELGEHQYLRQMQVQLEAEGAHRHRVVWWTAGAISVAAFVVGEFLGGAGQEEGRIPPPLPAVDGDGPMAAPEFGMKADMTAIVVLAILAITVVIVTLRVFVRRA